MKKLIIALMMVGAGAVSAQMKHQLPPLPYENDALEPVMSQETLEYHHGKHVQAYVDKLNELIPGTSFEEATIQEITAKAEGPIFNNGAQIMNHILFFEAFAPVSKAKTVPTGGLSDAIKKSFGSFEEFKKEFSGSALALFGSGWTWLVSNPEGELYIVSMSNAGNPLRDGFRPLLGVDVWEHSYYIDYRNSRANYLDSLWKIVDWEVVEKRYSE